MPSCHENRRAMYMPCASFHASTPPTLSNTPRCCDVKGNNAYIFPGVGLAAVACGATRITDLDMYIAAKALAEAVTTVSSSRVEENRQCAWALGLMRVCSLHALLGLHGNHKYASHHSGRKSIVCKQSWETSSTCRYKLVRCVPRSLQKPCWVSHS